MKIAVLTNDRYLKRLIELSLRGEAVVVDYAKGVSADALFVDADFGAVYDFVGKTIRFSRHGIEGTYPIPFPRGVLTELLEKGGDEARLFLRSDGRFAVKDGKEIKLTAQEFSLLEFLLSKNGDYATREEISASVWGNASDGLINIYIHYLREKLEGDGEKIIISSRSHGYRISDKYTR